MKIGELGRHTGLAPSAIRYYERLGLLPAPDRTSGQRRYSDDAYHRVLLVRFASDMGFSLGEIKLFLNGLRDEAPIGRARRLKSLLEHLLECRCLSLRICVQRLSLSPDMRLVGQRQPAQDRARRTNRGGPVRTSSERRGR